MSGNGMTGGRGSRSSNLLVTKDSFFKWIDSLRSHYRVFGPAREKDQALFREISSSGELFMEYTSTMLSPGKLFIYKSKEDILKFKIDDKVFIEELSPEVDKQVVVSIHSCDISAILYLDKTFLGAFVDPYYKIRRDNTFLIGLNCMQVSDYCFCSSLGTGPHLKSPSGYDMVLTDFGDDYLVELKSISAHQLFDLAGKDAGQDEWKQKSEQEEVLLKTFKKVIDVRGLDELFMKNLDHHVWAETADERCLSCSNCVMVCPTCFCYDLVDEMSMDLKEVVRFRQWDACQDMRFAAVHGGNYRGSRTSRLRQFVMHKLNYSSQYDSPGTVGCGRCIMWCPTKIDLTEMAKEIQRRPLR